jgi:DNA repair protein RecN (Recombination protein N)
LQLIVFLQKKNIKLQTAELIEIQNDLDTKVVSVSTLDLKLRNRTSLSEFEQHLNDLALEISTKRVTAIPILSERLSNILKQLGMENARFNIQIFHKETTSRMEKTKFNFYFLLMGFRFWIVEKSSFWW